MKFGIVPVNISVLHACPITTARIAIAFIISIELSLVLVEVLMHISILKIITKNYICYWNIDSSGCVLLSNLSDLMHSIILTTTKEAAIIKNDLIIASRYQTPDTAQGKCE